jgi:hypothetical protein
MIYKRLRSVSLFHFITSHIVPHKERPMLLHMRHSLSVDGHTHKGACARPSGPVSHHTVSNVHPMRMLHILYVHLEIEGRPKASRISYFCVRYDFAQIRFLFSIS